MKVKGKSAPKEQLKGPEVCTDPVTLANYAVGVNYLKDSPEVALKPDSEYPEWYVGLTRSAASRLGVPRVGEMQPSKLPSNCSSSVLLGAALCLPLRSLTRSVFAPRLFQIHLGPPKKLEEMDPDSLEYWRRLRKYNTWQRNKLKKSRKL